MCTDSVASSTSLLCHSLRLHSSRFCILFQGHHILVCLKTDDNWASSSTVSPRRERKINFFFSLFLPLVVQVDGTLCPIKVSHLWAVSAEETNCLFTSLHITCVRRHFTFSRDRRRGRSWRGRPGAVSGGRKIKEMTSRLRNGEEGTMETRQTERIFTRPGAQRRM